MHPALTWTRLQPLLARALAALRHPTRRGVARALAWTLAGGLALGLLYALVLIPFTPGIRDLRKAKSEQPAQVLWADGTTMTEFKRSNREWVKLADISPQVVAALIATEDHRFYEHHGIDWLRTGSAALKTFSGERQGGSTLTQQLARNLYPENIGRAPNLTRKLKEAITALKIEALYTKDEILETYLNTVPFLYNAWGIEMAARTYFDTSADQLDVLQGATLVGMLKGNSYYNPVLNPERALRRRNTVLAQMVKRQKLDPARYEQLKNRPLRIDFERQTEPTGDAPHFAQQLRKLLIAWADRNGYNLYADGLVIHTPLDARLQALANQAVARQGKTLQAIADAAWRPGRSDSAALVQAWVRESPDYQSAVAAGTAPEQALERLQANPAFMQALHRQKTTVQAGFLALDPQNGQVRAWVGSRDFSEDAFDHVQQARRQPGSTFKPFVYGAAFAQGARPEDTFIDQALAIPLPGGEIWRPGDGTPPSGRPMSLRDGLAYSRNTITAQLMQSVGPARVAKLARAMGVRESPLDPVPSLALGTSPVTLREMVTAYGTLAHDGRYLAPVLLTRIENAQGEVLETFAPAQAERVLDADVAYTLLDVLRGVVNRGTGTAIRSRFGIRADVAGKTGTTQDNADGWFILMHPQLVAGAWVGFNDSRVTLRSDYWGQGAHSALPIVGEFFQRSLRARAIDPRARFVPLQEPGLLQRLWTPVRTAWQRLLAAVAPPAPATGPGPRRRPPPAPLPEPDPDPGPEPGPVPPAGVAPAPAQEPAPGPQATPMPTPAPVQPAQSTTPAYGEVVQAVPEVR
jgi:penicillin-binding protein 1A